MKRAQSAVEFVVLVSFLLLIFFAFLLSFQNKMLEVNKAQDVEYLREANSLVISEIELAQRMYADYTRHFDIPYIPGKEYVMNLTDLNELTASYNGIEYVNFLSINITGNFVLGENNTIYRTDGVVYFPDGTTHTDPDFAGFHANVNPEICYIHMVDGSCEELDNYPYGFNESCYDFFGISCNSCNNSRLDPYEQCDWTNGTFYNVNGVKVDNGDVCILNRGDLSCTYCSATCRNVTYKPVCGNTLFEGYELCEFDNIGAYDSWYNVSVANSKCCTKPGIVPYESTIWPTCSSDAENLKLACGINNKGAFKQTGICTCGKDDYCSSTDYTCSTSGFICKKPSDKYYSSKQTRIGGTEDLYCEAGFECDSTLTDGNYTSTSNHEVVSFNSTAPCDESASDCLKSYPDDKKIIACCKSTNGNEPCVFDEKCFVNKDVTNFGNNVNAYAYCDKGVWKDLDDEKQGCDGESYLGFVYSGEYEKLPSVNNIAQYNKNKFVSHGEYKQKSDEECCGDDSFEFLTAYAVVDITLNPSDDHDDLCCNNEFDCVFNNTCYDNGNYTKISGEYALCSNSTWVDLDTFNTGKYSCENTLKYEWIEGGYTPNYDSYPGEYDVNSQKQCCGDDPNEYPILVPPSSDQYICCYVEKSCILGTDCYEPGQTNPVDSNQVCIDGSWT